MQQRGTNTTMNFDCEEKTQPLQPSRGRNNTKSKVLVRSHAMREEASPPREPTPTSQHSPRFKGLTFSSSRNHSPISPYVVVSPSISRNGSPSRSSTNLCVSPTATLTPSPTLRHSPRTLSPHSDCTILQSEFIEVDGDNPKVFNNGTKTNGRRDDIRVYRTDIIVEEESSHRNYCGKTKNECNCVSQNCNRCLKSQDRNFNNNLSSNINNNVVCSPNTLTVNRVNMRGKLKQSSSQGSFEGSLCNSPCLSRDNSSEQYFTDTTGVDLERFIPETLNKNAKDRALMLRIEQELVNLAKDDNKTHYKFPPMSSYQRMLVHRCAAYFGMDHNIEPAGKCVVVNKTKSTRIPEIQFRQHIKEDIVFSEEPRRSILKRDSNSMEDYSFKSPNRQSSLENRRSKSIEEREEEYQKAKKRIFNEMRECGSTDEFCWPEQSWSSMESENLSRFRLQLPDHSGRSSGRLLKVHSEEMHDERLRPCVAKSNSFGGYCGTHGRDNASINNTPRLLTKQDSAASSVSWRLSPSSSGYKTQSQRSESVTPSPTSTPYMSGESIRQDSTASVATNTSEQPSPCEEHGNDQTVWVLTDLHSTPKGSVIINPQTGQPVTNQDGTTYHYDPCNPPPNIVLNNPPVAKPPPSPIKHVSPQRMIKERPPSPKKRSKSSPLKKCTFTNSSTSPSLPFTPPPIQNRSYQYIAPVENSTNNLPVQPQQFVYGQNYQPNVPDNSVSIYPQPYLVYSPYNVPVHYDNRMQESQIPDVTTYYMPEAGPHTTVYQPQPPTTWNQPPGSVYQSTQSLPQRFNVPVHGQSTSFVSTYPTNYVQHTQNPQTAEVASMYQQPVQVIYTSQPPQPNNTMIYPHNQGVMYAQNPVYPNPQVYSNQSNHINYPQCNSTPSACPPPSSTMFCGQVFDQTIPPSGVAHLSQNMSQLNLNTNSFLPVMPKSMVPNASVDIRGKAPTPKGNKFSTPKGFGVGSSHSSTEANSPAMTVIASYCQNQGGVVYRTPSETPPTHGYPGNYIPTPPIMIRQMNNIRASPPVTNRSSRSPTPASDIVDRQRMLLPPPLYQGIPYVLQPERLMAGRGQPNTYRTPPIRQQNLPHGTDSKAHKNRKTRGKLTNLPPNGKQSNQ